jgi:ubiquitin carboxyl-terminal hydrolase L3
MARNLGVPSNWSFSDVFDLDDDLLQFIPQPSIAVILLFPSSKKTPVDETKRRDNNQVFFLEQIDALDDACGTIAVIHSIANNLDRLEIGIFYICLIS